MAVTRSTAAERANQPALIRPAFVPRALELTLLLGASAVVAVALLFVYLAKSAEAGQNQQPTVNLTRLTRADALLPALMGIESPTERQYIAGKIFERVRELEGKLPNVGTLGRIRVPVREVLGTQGLPGLEQRARGAGANADTIPLLTNAQLAELKPRLVVREWSEYRWRLLGWTLAFFVIFFAAHAFWMIGGFDGAQHVMPALCLLAGVGLVLMISLRDPLRDTMMFGGFVQGVVLGCLAMAAASLVDYRRLLGSLSYVPLIASLVLSAALILFGSGPTGSDAKVNLLGFQPAEVIKILLVLFLAGYFANRWELLRSLREQRSELQRVSRWVEVPRLEYIAPVLVGLAVSLAFFFLQRDLGPALVLSALFLAMYAVARDRYLFAASGFAIMLAGFAAGYMIGYPRTVAQRVDMWLSPWDNAVRGGEQVVHSLWGLATGGAFGTGVGLGDPEIMPAGHTDLVLAGVGEEWGFVGLLAVFTLYTLLAVFGLRTALRAKSDYSFFLATGLTFLVTFEALFIAAGVTGVLPLSGVVTPFLSYGRTALLTNFAIAGALLALSRERGDGSVTRPFAGGIRGLSIAMAALAVVIVARVVWVQVIRADEMLGAGSLTMQADGFRRYQYNPRLLAIARTIPRGSIYDRNGLPLASGDWAEIEKHRAAYARLGIALPQQPPHGDTRFYPLGAYTVHLLGDLRTRANWGARNSSLAERDFANALQGFDDRAAVVEVPDPRTKQPAYSVRYDYRELVPLLRHRYQPDHEAVKKVRDRNRNVRMSIDTRLQLRASHILERHLRRLQREKGALVVMDPATGDLLASVSYPWPAEMPPVLTATETDDQMLDRARYGVYPPGSTFKIVTAMAALRRDPNNAQQQYECKRLPDGRVGNYVRGWGRPVRDDVKDQHPHGVVAMQQGIVASCNAYFAQLATYKVGPEALHQTANLLGIAVARPNAPEQVKEALPQAGYGQGQVLATPFQMARAAATIAAGGRMPFGRWVIDQNNPRQQGPQAVLAPNLAGMLAGFMRGVVTSGTGRAANVSTVPVAGKTGTAEVTDKPSHAWFVGFAPYAGPGRRIAFAVLIEHGQYGGTAAAPVAAELVTAARESGLIGATP